MSVYHVYTWYPWRPEENDTTLGTGVTVDFEPPLGCWELNLGPLQEQPMLLNAESSLP